MNKKRVWTGAAIISCGLWVGSTSSWAMGPGGTCANGPSHGAQQPPMQTLMTLDSTLDLNSEQKKAWDEFVTTLNTRRGEMMSTMMAGRTAATTGSAPARLRNNAEMMGKRAGMMRSMAEALDKLYAKLTPEQQAVIDSTLAGHDGPGN